MMMMLFVCYYGYYDYYCDVYVCYRYLFYYYYDCTIVCIITITVSFSAIAAIDIVPQSDVAKRRS